MLQRCAGLHHTLNNQELRQKFLLFWNGWGFGRVTDQGTKTPSGPKSALLGVLLHGAVEGGRANGRDDLSLGVNSLEQRGLGGQEAGSIGVAEKYKMCN